MASNDRAADDEEPTRPATSDLVVSWDRLHADARTLAARLHGFARPWGRVIAVTRGGMVPACIVARELGIRRVEAISVVSYEHQAQGAVRILGAVEAPVPRGENAERHQDLVVDDLVDTGETFRALRERLPAAHYAAVYAKPKGRPFADTYVTDVGQGVWIHLPWDLALHYAPPLVE